MQQNIFYAHIYFQFSICKNVDATRRKPILIAKSLLNADWNKFGGKFIRV
jgi:hypothetical protein